MRFLADENFPKASILKLRTSGHVVIAVSEVLSGSSDSEVLRASVERDAVLVTFDRDFGALVFEGGGSPAPGIILLRLSPSSPTEPADILLSFLDLPEVQIEGFFSVVDRDRARQRKLPELP